jgi:hypothetical protein
MILSKEVMFKVSYEGSREVESKVMLAYDTPKCSTWHTEYC